MRSLVPDPFAIALLLTLVAFAGGWALGTTPLLPLIDAWAAGASGFWSYLGFAMQMCLILVTGFAVASSRPVQAGVRTLARLPRSPGQAAAMVSVCAMGAGLLNWGLGLVAGALLAREVGHAMADQGRPVHYPLLAAAGYTSMCVWHGGLSGSAPLKVTQLADLTEVLGPELAAAVGPISLSRTVASPGNALLTGALLLVIPLVLAAMAPSDPRQLQPPPPRPPDRDRGAPSPGLAGALDEGPWLILPFAALMGTWALRWLLDGGLQRLGPNELNFLFLMAGLLLLGSPARYMRAATLAAPATAGILIQFPLYAGIRGILVDSGLVQALGAALPESGTGLLLATFGSAGLLNLFVPSGGGQWGIQGPLVMGPALEAGVDPARVVMALAYGDQWTNLFQPFWALPLLGITGTRASDILGYTAVLGVVVGVVLAVGLWLG